MAFLTLFGSARAPTPTTFVWFPVVGGAIGAVVGGVWWAAARGWPPLLAATLAVVADLVLTGLLHLDGLIDSADGLLAPMTRPRRLAVMADPAAGAFGVVSAVAVLVLRVGALASLRPTILAVVGIWCASRTLMVAMTWALPYARTGGLVTSFLAVGSRGAVTRVAVASSTVVGLVLAGAALVWSSGARGWWSLVAEVLAVAAVGVLSWRRIGGFTGDVLGAAGVVGETCALVVLAWR